MNDLTQGYDLGATEDTPSGVHELHISHLVMGVAFVGIALVWLLSAVGAVPETNLNLLIPVPFLVAGGVGLLALVLSRSR